MSTKATIAYAENFHFYHEVFDDDHVYLRLEGVEFEADQNGVTVSIPIAIWEVIRKRGGTDLALAEKSDEELRTLVETEVDERIACYAQNPRTAGLGAMIFGSADEPRDVQIASGLEEYREERARQHRIKEAVAELEAKNPMR